MTTEPSWTPDRLDEITECLGGEVHLACAHRPESGAVVVAAGYTADAALSRAETRATAADTLLRLGDLPLARATGGDELTLSDFVPASPAGAEGPPATGFGLISHDRYLIPSEIVSLTKGPSRVEPTLAGLVGGHPAPVAAAVAEMLAYDAFSHWWEEPGESLLRVSGYFDRLLPPRLESALSGLGLWVTAFVVPGAGFRLVVVSVSGDGTTIAVSAGTSVRQATREALLRAIEARVQPWATLPVADSLRRLTVWHRESDYVAHLERSAVDAHPAIVDEPEDVPRWVQVAGRRFAREPIAVTAEPDGDPVRIVCPGARCHRATPSGTTFPCPIP